MSIKSGYSNGAFTEEIGLEKVRPVNNDLDVM